MAANKVTGQTGTEHRKQTQKQKEQKHYKRKVLKRQGNTGKIHNITFQMCTVGMSKEQGWERLA